MTKTQEAMTAMNEAAEAVKALATDLHGGKLAEMQAAVESAIEAQTGAVDRRFGDVLSPIILYLDNARHNKATLGIKADPDDETMSEWTKVPTTGPGSIAYPAEGKITKIHTTFCYSAAPGHWENPPYGVNHSRGYIQFAVASIYATSQQINERLATLGKSPPDCGGWWSGSAVYNGVTVRIPNLNAYSQPFVRFINRGANGKPAQNIVNFGSDGSFSVDRVINYPTLQQI